MLAKPIKVEFIYISSVNSRLLQKNKTHNFTSAIFLDEEPYINFFLLWGVGRVPYNVGFSDMVTC